MTGLAVAQDYIRVCPAKLFQPFAAVVGKPGSAGGSIIANRLRGDFTQRLKGPTLCGCADGAVDGNLNESGYGLHSLLAGHRARPGQAGGTALPDVRGWIIAEHIEKIRNGIVTAKKGQPVNGPIACSLSGI